MKDKQNEDIIKKVKLKVAISNFCEEEKVDMKKTSKNVIKIATVASMLLVCITSAVFAKDIANFIKKVFGPNTSDGVDTAVENGYILNEKTQVEKANGIEVSVDSIIMDDFNFAINFNMKLDEKYNIDEFEHNADFVDLKVIDEENNIVFSTNYKETNDTQMQDENWEPEYLGAYGVISQKLDEQNLKLTLSATGNPKLFPKSKYLQIDFSKIRVGEWEKETRTAKIYEGKWNFEIDIPEEFYKRETYTYKAKSCNDKNIDINEIEAIVSKTGCRIYIPLIKETSKIDYKLIHDSQKSPFDRAPLQKEYVETSNGKIFETAARSDGDGCSELNEKNEIKYYNTFNLTTYDATDTVTLNITTNKKENIIIELEKMLKNYNKAS